MKYQIKTIDEQISDVLLSGDFICKKENTVINFIGDIGHGNLTTLELNLSDTEQIIINFTVRAERAPGMQSQDNWNTPNDPPTYTFDVDIDSVSYLRGIDQTPINNSYIDKLCKKIVDQHSTAEIWD